MDMHLTAELEQLVENKVRSGPYKSISEVVREALLLLDERDRMIDLRRNAIRKKIDEGWESLQRGEGLDGDEVFFELNAELDAVENARKVG
jgi:antitoxin ParD1/3/4